MPASQTTDHATAPPVVVRWWRRAAPALAGVLGAPVAAPFGWVARLRHARGLHPAGTTHHGTLDLVTPLGGLVAGRHRAVVRLSRGAGLPEGLPDVLGVAVRVMVGGAPQDLLVSSSGPGRWRRRVPWPAVDADDAFHTSLTPLDLGDRVAHLAVRAEGAGRYAVLVPAGGWWAPVGVLHVGAARSTDDDEALDLDPWNAAAGIEPVGLLAHLRRPAYAASRAGRRRPARQLVP